LVSTINYHRTSNPLLSSVQQAICNQITKWLRLK
jgi:hypothetical protein